MLTSRRCVVPMAAQARTRKSNGPKAEVRIGSVARKLSFVTSYQH